MLFSFSCSGERYKERESARERGRKRERERDCLWHFISIDEKLLMLWGYMGVCFSDNIQLAINTTHTHTLRHNKHTHTKHTHTKHTHTHTHTHPDLNQLHNISLRHKFIQKEKAPQHTKIARA